MIQWHIRGMAESEKVEWPPNTWQVDQKRGQGHNLESCPGVTFYRTQCSGLKKFILMLAQSRKKFILQFFSKKLLGSKLPERFIIQMLNMATILIFN